MYNYLNGKLKNKRKYKMENMKEKMEGLIYLEDGSVYRGY